MRKQLCATVFVCLALALATTQGQQAQSANNRFMPGEIIVKFRASTSAAQRDAIISSRAGGLIRRFNALGLHRLRVRNGQSVESAVTAFRALPDVVLAQPNYIRRAFKAIDPDDPFWQFGFQWGPQKIQAPDVWNEYTTGSPDVVIASIDTGIDYTHPDLAANMWHNPGEVPNNGLDDDNNGYVDDVYGIDTVNGDSDPLDDQGHGTQTAGIMAMVGNNGLLGVGVTWNSKVLTCKFVDQTGSGTDADAIECFNYLVTMKQRGVNIRVSNNSWGSLRENPPALALKDAIDAAGAAGILNVFAAGNDGTNNDVLPFDPASFASPSIISVAASDDADNRASFSNYGANSVHLAAPGVFIFTTAPGSIGFADGTSMAAPMVSGAAALLTSYDPTLTVDQLRARLITSVDVLPQWGGVVASGGRLNVFSAIGLGGNARPTVTLTSPSAGSTFVAPAAIALEAAATDSDGTIAKVDFFANGTLVGTDTTSPYAVTWPNVGVGTHTLTAEATDDLGAARMSNPVTVTVTTPPWRVNVALAANGGTAAASSTYSASYAASSANNGDRKGIGWGNGGNWNDATGNAWPDWLEVSFNGAQTIEEIDVFTMQDNYQAPSEPTASMTFSQYGIRDFEVQVLDGHGMAGGPQRCGHGQHAGMAPVQLRGDHHVEDSGAHHQRLELAQSADRGRSLYWSGRGQHSPDGDPDESSGRQRVCGVGDRAARGQRQRPRGLGGQGRVLREWGGRRHRHDQSLRRLLDQCASGQLQRDGRSNRQSRRDADVERRDGHGDPATGTRECGAGGQRRYRGGLVDIQRELRPGQREQRRSQGNRVGQWWQLERRDGQCVAGLAGGVVQRLADDRGDRRLHNAG